MGLDIDPARKAILAQHCAGYGIYAGQAQAVFRLLADDAERSKQIRIFGTVTPSDIASAWQDVRARLIQAQRQADIGRASHVEPGEPIKTQILPAHVLGKADNIRRLEAGTTTAGPSGSAEDLASWKEYYGRGYVQDAQERARKILADYKGIDHE